MLRTKMFEVETELIPIITNPNRTELLNLNVGPEPELHKMLKGFKLIQNIQVLVWFQSRLI